LIVDVHTHCATRPRDDPFGVAHVLRGTPVGNDTVTNYRGLPAVSYHDMYDLELQQEVCAKAGITVRLISNPFAAEVMTAVSSRPAIDIVKYLNDQNAATVARAPGNFGLGTVNPLDADQVAEGERCLGALGFKGLLITSSWHGQFIDDEKAFPFWEWAEARQVPIFIHPPRVPIGHAQQMDQFKLDELVGRPFDTAMALARMILSGMLDRYSRLKIVVAHMGGGLLPIMGRLDFGWRLGCAGMPERAAVGELATGLALLIIPSLVGQLLLGAELNGVAIPVARVAGIALLALGIACWAGRFALVGMVTYSTLVALYLAYLGFAGRFVGVLLWPAVALHIVLAVLLMASLRSERRGSAGR